LRKRLGEAPAVLSVKGRGFLLGLEFADKAAPIHQELLKRRIITGTSNDPHVLRLLPPLCLREAEADVLIEALRDICSSDPQPTRNSSGVSRDRAAVKGKAREL